MASKETWIDNMKVDTGVLSPSDIWKFKDEYAKQELESRETWNKMSEEQRQITLTFVQRGLERLLDRLDAWVPTSLSVEQGRYLAVSFRMLFTDLEKELAAEEEITSRRIAEAAASTQALVEELEKK